MTVLTVRFGSSIVGLSAACWISVVTLALLLLVSKSVSSAVTLAVLTIWPAVTGVTTIVTIALAPTARLPMVQSTGFVPEQTPTVVVAETKFAVAGS
jgi:hypothetical protein